MSQILNRDRPRMSERDRYIDEMIERAFRQPSMDAFRPPNQPPSSPKAFAAVTHVKSDIQPVAPAAVSTTKTGRQKRVGKNFLRSLQEVRTRGYQADNQPLTEPSPATPQPERRANTRNGYRLRRIIGAGALALAAMAGSFASLGGSNTSATTEQSTPMTFSQAPPTTDAVEPEYLETIESALIQISIIHPDIQPGTPEYHEVIDNTFLLASMR